MEALEELQKECAKCKILKPVSEFYFRKDNGKYRAACKKCKSINTKEEIIARVSSPTKVCKHCNVEKSVDEYQKAGGGKWLQPYCKPCDAERKKKHYTSNLSDIKTKHKEYYLKTRKILTPEQRAESMKGVIIKLKESARKYWAVNTMSLEERKKRKSDCDRKYREKNYDKIQEVKKRYYQLKGREEKRLWQAKMMDKVEFRIKKNLRSRVYVALKRGIKSQSTMKLLGCTIEFFKEYFESLFTEGMSWEVYMNGGIHIDHVVPCKSFDLTKEDEQKKCFHYSNLQPLFRIDNLKKGTSLIYNKKLA